MMKTPPDAQPPAIIESDGAISCLTGRKSGGNQSKFCAFQASHDLVMPNPLRAVVLLP